jgi:Glycosyl hydrolase family 26/Fibronectin type III domain
MMRRTARRRRPAIRLLLTCGLALTLTGVALPAGGAPAAAAQTGDGSYPIVFGAPGGIIPTSSQAYQATETKLGRNLAAIRMYARWDTAFPDSTSVWASQGGRQVLLSVNAKTSRGQTVLYRDIAAATTGPIYDTMVRWATSVKSFGAPIYFTFNHEPEGAASANSGTATEYIAAWRRIVDVFRTKGVRNAEYLFIATANGFAKSGPNSAAPYYPGDVYVDDIGADAYNWFTCRAGIKNPWRSLANLIEALRQFGLSHPTKGLWLPEFGSAEDPALPGRKAQWVTDAQALFAQPAYASFQGVLTWYAASQSGACGFRVDSSPTTLSAYQSLAGGAHYQGTADPPATPRQVSAVSSGAGLVTVSWAAAGAGGSPVTGYRVSNSQTGATVSADGSASSATVLVPPGTYTYTVTATNDHGTGRPSAPSPAVTVGAG